MRRQIIDDENAEARRAWQDRILASIEKDRAKRASSGASDANAPRRKRDKFRALEARANASETQLRAAEERAQIAEALARELDKQRRAAMADARDMEERALAAEAEIARLKHDAATAAPIPAPSPAPAPASSDVSVADLRRQLTTLLVRAKAAEMHARDMESRALAAEELLARGR
jgi:hypothetical protein